VRYPNFAEALFRSPVHKDRQDFTIYSGDWATGRIYQQRGGPESMRWFWSLYGMVWHRAPRQFRDGLAGWRGRIRTTESVRTEIRLSCREIFCRKHV
jgi:hypothetical protein